jgi:hypothetical protein
VYPPIPFWGEERNNLKDGMHRGSASRFLELHGRLNMNMGEWMNQFHKEAIFPMSD